MNSKRIAAIVTMILVSFNTVLMAAEHTEPEQTVFKIANDKIRAVKGIDHCNGAGATQKSTDDLILGHVYLLRVMKDYKGDWVTDSEGKCQWTYIGDGHRLGAILPGSFVLGSMFGDEGMADSTEVHLMTSSDFPAHREVYFSCNCQDNTESLEVSYNYDTAAKSYPLTDFMPKNHEVKLQGTSTSASAR